MATYNKFQSGIENLLEVCQCGTDTFKIMLVNSPAPVNTNTVKADLTEITAQNGYSAGGATVTITGSSQAGGVFTLASNNTVITASGGSIGPFRYAVLYDDTPSSPADPLIGWWDYGSSISLNDGEPLNINAASLFTAT